MNIPAILEEESIKCSVYWNISSGEISLHWPANFGFVMFMGKNTASVHVAFSISERVPILWALCKYSFCITANSEGLHGHTGTYMY